MLSGPIKLDHALSKRSKSLNSESAILNSQADNIAKWKSSCQKSYSTLMNCQDTVAKISKNIMIGKHQKIWIEESVKLEDRRQYLQSILDHKYPLNFSADSFGIPEAANLRNYALEMVSKTPAEDSVNDRCQLRSKITLLLENDEKDIRALESQIASISKSTELLNFQVFIKFKDEISPFSSLTYKHDDLQSEHSRDCKALTKWYDEQITSLRQEYKHIIENPLGGLDEETYSIVTKLIDEYSAVHQEHFTLLSEAIKLQTNLKQKCISDFLQWYPKNLAYNSKKDIIKKAFNHRMEEFMQTTLKNLIEEEEMIAKQSAIDEENMQRAEKMKNLHNSLEYWRTQKVEKMRRENEKAQEQLQYSMQNEIERQRREKLVRAEELAKLEKYREKQRLEKIKQQELQKQLDDNLKEQMKIEAKYNKERVHYRANEVKRKEAEQVKKIKKIKEEQLELEKRLEKLRLTVAIEAPSDWDRTVGETVASKQYKECILKSHRADWWNYSTGFTTEEIFKDERMKLSLELYRNGLDRSEYANRILNRMQPEQRRPDQISTFKFGLNE